MLQPIEKISVYEEAARQIRTAIEEGTWLPGERLPSERELCKLLNVGRTSVREALRALQALDFIDIRPGEGSFVRERRLPLAEERVRLLLQSKPVADLYEVREMLECQMAALAAERAGPDDIAAMEAALDRMANKLDDPQACVAEDYAFHLALGQSADNEALLGIQRMLLDELHPAVERFLAVPGRTKRALSEHQAVLQAVKDSDPTLSHGRMHAHLQSRFKDPRLAEIILADKRDSRPSRAST